MRLRLVLSFVLVVLVSVSSVTLIAGQGAANEVRTFMFHGGMAGLTSIASQLENYYAEHHTWEGVASLLDGIMPGMGRGMGRGMMAMMGQRLRLADAHGNLVADTSADNPTGKLSAADIQVSVPLSVNGQVVGYLLPEGGGGYTPSDETFIVSRLYRAALTAGLIAGAVALLLALLLAYSLARPLSRLTAAAGRLAQGDLSQRVDVHGKDEVAALGQAFNHMVASLQQAESSRRAMTADIAHELRTPLAVQRAHLEALQDGVYPLVPENLVPIQEQNELLTHLVDDLRTLALADAGQLALERTQVDFPALAQHAVERFRPQADARRIDLRLEPVSQPVRPLSVDPLRVEQILSNLLSNALRHTPEGGQINCRVAPAGNNLVFTIQDSGPGIPAEALPHVFERFYRADRSRSRAEGGTGLGLAIARQLAEAHGGTLEAANNPGGGAILSLTLPL